MTYVVRRNQTVAFVIRGRLRISAGSSSDRRTFGSLSRVSSGGGRAALVDSQFEFDDAAQPPADLAETISDLLTIEAAARRQAPNPSLGHRIARFLEPRLMPYTVGSFASVIMFFLMFTALRPHFVALREAALQSNDVRSCYTPGYDLYEPKTWQESLPVVRHIRTVTHLKPKRRLAALTRAYAHTHASYYSDRC